MAPVTESVKNRYGDQVEFKTLTIGDGVFETSAKKWNVSGTPTYVIMDAAGKEIGRVKGPGKTEADFDAVLAKINVAPVK